MSVVPVNILQHPVPSTLIESAPKPSVANVVVTFSLANMSLDARWLQQVLPGVSYKPDDFVHVKIHINDAVMLVFTGGTVVCPGAHSVQHARRAALHLCSQLLSMGQIVNFRNFHVRNVVCSAQVNFEVDVQKLAHIHSTNVTYSADKFPAPAWRFSNTSVAIVVFVSGTCNIVGAKSYEVARKCWAWFYHNILVNFKLSTRISNSATFRVQRRRSNTTALADAQALWRKRSERVTNYISCPTPSRSVPTTPQALMTPSHWSQAPDSLLAGLNTPRADGTNELLVSELDDLLLTRMSIFFGHTAHCPFIADGSTLVLEAMRRDIFHALQSECYADAISDHVRSNCVTHTQVTKVGVRQYLSNLVGQIDAYLEHTYDARTAALTDTTETEAVEFDAMYAYNLQVLTRLSAYRGDEDAEQSNVPFALTPLSSYL